MDERIRKELDEIHAKMDRIKIEGYWYSEYEPEYPTPIPNVLTQEEAQKIYDLIVLKQQNKEVNLLIARGCSYSRITKEPLGCTEHVDLDNEWKWPGDFAKHYVLEHRVKPTDDFLKYIGYEKL